MIYSIVVISAICSVLTICETKDPNLTGLAKKVMQEAQYDINHKAGYAT